VVKTLKQILKKIDWKAVTQFLAISAIIVFPLITIQSSHAQLVDTFVNQCPADTGVRCSEGSIAAIFKLIINWALAIAFIAAVIMLIVGGFRYITSAGNTDSATKGKNAIVNALIGIVIIVLSYIIVQIVYRFVAGTGTGGVLGP